MEGLGGMGGGVGNQARSMGGGPGLAGSMGGWKQ